VAIPTYVVEGTVINSATGEPIRAALVQIHIGQQISLLTGADGKFRFDTVPQSQLTITVQKPGFFSEQEISQGPIPNQLTQVGPGMKPVIMRLIPEGAIYGRITDSDGDPILDLQIGLVQAAIVNGQKRWQQMGSQQTKEDGEFRFFGLLPGAYYLRTESTPVANLRVGANSETARGGYPSNYYPGKLDLGSATAIAVEPAKEVRADFSVKREALYQVSGRVIGAPRQMSLGIQVLGSDGEWLNGGVQMDPRAETFTAFVPKGSYVIKAYANGNNGPQGVAVQSVNVNGDVAGLSLALAPLATIPVDVRFEITQNTNSGPYSKDMQPVSVTLVSKGTVLSNQGYGATMQGQPEGQSFAVRNVEPGRYTAQLIATGHWYIESARCGQVNLVTEDLSVETGGTRQPIEIVLRDDFATVSGAVSLDGQPAKATVLLMPDGNPRGAVALLSNPDGRFQKEDLPPGDYKAIAFDRVDGLEYTNTEAMRAYFSWEQPVHVSPNGQATVQLELQKRGN
jgi:Carboxypeptidase regulatory-like domain